MAYNYVRPMTTQDIAVQVAEGLRGMGDILSKPFLIQLDRQLRQQDLAMQNSYDMARDERRYSAEEKMLGLRSAQEERLLGIKNKLEMDNLKQKFGYDLMLTKAAGSKYEDYYNEMKKYKEWEIENTPRLVDEPMLNPDGSLMLDINQKPILRKVYQVLNFGDELDQQLPYTDFGYRPGFNSYNRNQIIPETVRVLSRPERPNVPPTRSPLMQDIAQGGTFTDRVATAAGDMYQDFTNNFNNIPTELLDPYMGMGTGLNRLSNNVMNDIKRSRTFRAMRNRINDSVSEVDTVVPDVGPSLKKKALNLFLQKLFNQ